MKRLTPNIFAIYTLLLISISISISLASLYELREYEKESRKQIQQMWEQIKKDREFIDNLQVGEFTATAYSPHDDRNGINSWKPKNASRSYTPRTRSGTIPNINTIAVDPKIIPLGSKVLINGKVYIAEDTGGNVKGMRIDFYRSTYPEAMKYGRQKVRAIWLKA
jgi:3D (Asp-Asp-Asp) domain-containing protein